MSVRGEFVRIVGDAVNGLRAVGSEPSLRLATELEQARAGAADDLTASAERVLELCDGGALAPLGADGDAGERLLAIARIVLGR